MNLDEIIAAIGGPTAVPHQPEGPSDVTPLSQLGLDRPGGEAAPVTVTGMQGAGSTGYLTPGAQGTAGEGSPVKGWKGSAYEDQGGPDQRPILSGVARLTAGQINTPADGSPVGDTAPAAAPVGRPDTALGRDQSQGQGINPALKAALRPRLDGPFGKPS